MATTFENFFRDFNRAIEPPVRQHLTNVYACLAASCLTAGIGATLNVLGFIGSFNFLTTIVAIGLLFGLMVSRDNGKNRQTRLGLLLGFSFCTGLSLGELVNLAIHLDPSIIVTALLSTAAIFTCFSIASLTAERAKFLYLGGTLMTFVSMFFIVGIANMFIQSELIAQAYLYIGLAVMCGFVLYDTQVIMEKRRAGDKDFILHSVDLFIDMVGIFRRLLIILMQREAQKKENKKRKN